jgi:hypothetical protein
MENYYRRSPNNHLYLLWIGLLPIHIRKDLDMKISLFMYPFSLGG